jgi:hypothetical protein
MLQAMHLKQQSSIQEETCNCNKATEKNMPQALMDVKHHTNVMTGSCNKLHTTPAVRNAAPGSVPPAPPRHNNNNNHSL